MPKSSHGKYKEMPHNQAGRERGASIMEKTDCPVPGLARGYGFSRQAGPVSQKRIGQREVDQSAVPVYADVHFVAKPFVFLLYHPAVYDRFFVRHFPDSHQIAIVCLAKKVYNTER